MKVVHLLRQNLNFLAGSVGVPHGTRQAVLCCDVAHVHDPPFVRVPLRRHESLHHQEALFLLAAVKVEHIVNIPAAAYTSNGDDVFVTSASS